MHLHLEISIFKHINDFYSSTSAAEDKCYSQKMLLSMTISAATIAEDLLFTSSDKNFVSFLWIHCLYFNELGIIFWSFM